MHTSTIHFEQATIQVDASIDQYIRASNRIAGRLFKMPQWLLLFFLRRDSGR
jgi:hypothetical protein